LPQSTFLKKKPARGGGGGVGKKEYEARKTEMNCFTGGGEQVMGALGSQTGHLWQGIKKKQDKLTEGDWAEGDGVPLK